MDETETVKEEKLTMQEVQLLGHISTLCPYCEKTIYMPEYRIQPRTYEEARRLDIEIAKKLIKVKQNEQNRI